MRLSTVSSNSLSECTWIAAALARNARLGVNAIFPGLQFAEVVKAAVARDHVRDLMAEEEIDGALVGGASLDAESFASIVNWKS